MSINRDIKDRITLQDIAKELGVSIGTVDRAIHNRPDVSSDTRSKVLKLIEDYNYKTDKVARSLSLRSKKIRIGVICQSEAKFFWDNVKNGIKAAESELSDFGLEIIYREMDPNRKLEIILQDMDELIDMNVDAIALVPVDDPAVKEKIDEAFEKGIPVATFNDDIDGSKRIFYVGPQIRQTGRIAGELMGNFLHNRGKVFTISLELTSLEYKERLEGFKEVMQEQFSNVKKIGGFTYNYKNMGSDIIGLLKNLLENLGEVDGIYDITGGCLNDVANIVKNAEKLRGVVLVGHEVWSGVKESIIDGTIKACISQDPYSQGYFIIKLLFDFLNDGKRPAFERMYTRLDIVMRENLINQANVINPYYIHTK